MPAADVLIAGAGPTGLVLALWLTHFGIRVRIVDKAAEPGTTSRALAVQARTLELYRQMGLAQAVVDRGAKVAGANFWVKGRHRARVSLQGIGEGISEFAFLLIYPQDEHEKLLIARLADLGVHVERNTELIRFTELLRFTEPGKEVNAVLKRDGNTEEGCYCRYIVGCDGARSKVREIIGTGFPGGTYEHFFYVADVEAAGPAINRELNIDLDHADFVVVFPLHDEGHIRLIGTVKERPDCTPADLTFNDVGRRAIEQLKVDVRKVSWFSTYHVHHRVTDHFRKGRAFLAGDAAHIHSPAGGQGMNTGIGDAINLAWKLAAVLQGKADDALLDTYEAERIGFARQLVATTDRVFTAVTSTNRWAKFVRTRLFPLIMPVAVRFAFVRRFLFRTVSQTQIQYRESPLSEGRAGVVLGGDRLPWIRFADGTSNYDTLAEPRWQVHVYGDVDSPLEMACRELGVVFHRFAWQREMSDAGLTEGAMYLLRPDQYVALVEKQGVKELRNYFESRQLRP
ncbi:Pentachlorophenol 4-monooxygenase [Caulifigura coniformis]|uniref:Pentachlorophenol 4-monooxygenase n=1 Tax=Caulifigura coniformis TaxID=2527983 RepID=A0A517SE42_9PLAN|nr:FAD-dependent monooxygenase [Caulifigura coniformis]QDT54399.1 Pentachlorophenol 4-monooxygenase [Caulifigura coniformis]